jgi:hypothetical protein
MSVSTHRAPRSSRLRRWRLAAAGIGVAALALVSIPAFADDTIKPDGDTAHGGPNITYTGTNCPNGSTVTGEITVNYNGQSAGHFSANESLTVEFHGQSGGAMPAGVTVTPGVIPNVPSDWGTATQTFPIPFSTKVDTGSAGGKVEVTVTGNQSGYSAGADSGNGKPNFMVTVTCTPTTDPGPTNHAPVVSFTNPPTTANEGDTKVFNFSITDAEAGDTQTYVSGYPDCGTGNVLVSSSTGNTGGTFSCRFVDGLVPAVANTVKVKVNDGTADSNEATTDVTVSNLAPVVAQPTFSVVTVDCQVQVSLNNISFSDAGVNDKTWSIDINWGDGSTHDVVPTDTQGLQSSVNHTYAVGGTFGATVTVTDKDHVDGSNTTSSSGSITVIQYRTDFLPPFDDSSPSGLIVNSMKNGRTVPVKATIYDLCARAYVTSPSVVTIGVKKVATPTTDPASDAIENYSDAGASSGNTNLFRWTSDSTAPGGGFWIYNLDSKALALVTNSYYRIDMYVGGVQATKTDWGILQPVK